VPVGLADGGPLGAASDRDPGRRLTSLLNHQLGGPVAQSSRDTAEVLQRVKKRAPLTVRGRAAFGHGEAIGAGQESIAKVACSP
jgi:hypothetical protein